MFALQRSLCAENQMLRRRNDSTTSRLQGCGRATKPPLIDPESKQCSIRIRRHSTTAVSRAGQSQGNVRSPFALTPFEADLESDLGRIKACGRHPTTVIIYGRRDSARSPPYEADLAAYVGRIIKA